MSEVVNDNEQETPMGCYADDHDQQQLEEESKNVDNEGMICITLSSANSMELLDQLPIRLKQNSGDSKLLSPCGDIMNNYGQTPTPGITTEKTKNEGLRIR